MLAETVFTALRAGFCRAPTAFSAFSLPSHPCADQPAPSLPIREADGGVLRRSSPPSITRGCDGRHIGRGCGEEALMCSRSVGP